MRIFVLGNAQRPGVAEEAQRLLPFLREQCCGVVVFDLLGEKDVSQESADLALVLGGDGAILRAARQMGYRQTPVLGINLGKLGFLADLTPDQLRQAWPRVLQGDYRVTHHLMFECLVETPDRSDTYLGLNDVTVHAGPPFHMIELDLLVDGQVVAAVSGDGLIIATPIGSTAHSLSAGGPIVGQELCAFAITPISPHTLTLRPVVDSADKVYTIVPRRLSAGSALTIDGQDTLALTTAHRVTVRRAPVSFGLVKVPGHNYYQTLRDKLRWGTGPNYRAEPSGDGLAYTQREIAMPVCKRVYYSGHVQGVGFRYTAQHLAAGHRVAGYVRNLPGGDVELVAEGEPDEVERFLGAVAGRMAANIERSTVHDEAPAGRQGFHVRH